MPDTVREFTVTASMAAVVDYLKDFSRAQEWDPGTVTCTRVDAGPVSVGSRWRNVSKFAGRETELDYRLTVLTSDRLTFVGDNKTATSTDDITLVAVDGGTRVRYLSHIVFNGAAKLAGPFLRPMLKTLGDKTEQQLTDILNGLGDPA